MKNKLDKWGYGYTDWTRNGVRITYIPTTAAERLAEIMIREYGLDVQIDCVSFAIFVTAFNDIDGFDSMPWGERAKELREKYGVDVSDNKWGVVICQKEYRTRDTQASSSKE